MTENSPSRFSAETYKNALDHLKNKNVQSNTSTVEQIEEQKRIAEAQAKKGKEEKLIRSSDQLEAERLLQASLGVQVSTKSGLPPQTKELSSPMSDRIPLQSIAGLDETKAPPASLDVSKALPELPQLKPLVSTPENLNAEELVAQIRAKGEIYEKIALVLPLIGKHLGLSLPADLSKPDGIKFNSSGEGQISIVNIRGIQSTLRDIAKANLAHTSGSKEISKLPELGNIVKLLFEEITPKYEKGNRPLIVYNTYYQLENLSKILSGELGFGIDPPSNDIICAFKRENVKNRFILGIKEFTEEQKEMAKGHLRTFTGGTDSPEGVYNAVIERVKAGSNMKWIICDIMIAMGGEYKVKGKELEEQIEKGILRGYTGRVS